jgi:hypothetical protein
MRGQGTLNAGLVPAVQINGDATPSESMEYPMRIFRLAMLAFSLLCLSPAFILAGVAIVSSACGCQVHEGYANPCIINGRDVGGLFYSLGMRGWLVMATLPVLAGVPALWIAAELIRFLISRAVR